MQEEEQLRSYGQPEEELVSQDLLVKGLRKLQRCAEPYKDQDCLVMYTSCLIFKLNPVRIPKTGSGKLPDLAVFLPMEPHICSPP